MKILAVDPGDARTGLACCDEEERLASPAGVIFEYNRERLIERIAQEAKRLNAAHILVGNPINMNGTLGPRSESARALSEALHHKTSLPVTLWDERCTTVSAIDILNTTNVRRAKRKNVIDAVAAVVLLESFISFRKNRKEQKPSE
jgi:putative Holliday junction resolvase